MYGNTTFIPNDRYIAITSKPKQMNRTKAIIAILATTLALTSCQQTYNCVCAYRPGQMEISNTPRYDIKARNHSKAVENCDAKDTPTVDCTLQ
jgi:hypothetical protein